MNKVIIFYFFSVFSSITITSCITTFNTTHKARIENAGIPLSKVQFFNDKKIVLSRALTETEANTLKGLSKESVQIKNGVYVETIIIPKKTHGRSIANNNLSLRISFENDDEGLIFWSIDGGTTFFLTDGKNFLRAGSKLQYDGKTYSILEGNYAKLLFRNNIKTKKPELQRIIKDYSID